MPPVTFELALVQLTRNKVENLGNIARAARLTNGVVMVDGAKTDGIESILKQVQKGHSAWWGHLKIPRQNILV